MPHSSGGGSHGGGSHGGGFSSGGGSHGGGHSAPPVYNTYHPGTHRYVYYRHGRPMYYYSSRKVEDTRTSSIFSLIVSCVLLAIICALIFSSIKAPHKLSMNYDTEILVKDNIDVLSSSDESELQAALYDFQEQTGITPALVTVDNSVWQPYYTSLENYAYDVYVNTFDDEKHWLFVYSTAQNDSFDDWYWEGIQGDDTDSILYSSLLDSFNNNVQKYLTQRTRYTVGQAFAQGIQEATANAQKTHIDFDLLPIIFVLTCYVITMLPGAIRGLSSQEKSKAKRCPDDQAPTSSMEDTCEYCGGVYVHGLHTSCPHCGAPIKAVQNQQVYQPAPEPTKAIDIDQHIAEYPTIDCIEADMPIFLTIMLAVGGSLFSLAGLAAMVMTLAFGSFDIVPFLLMFAFLAVGIIMFVIIGKWVHRNLLVKNHGKDIHGIVAGYQNDPTILINGMPAQIVQIDVDTKKGKRTLLYQLRRLGQPYAIGSTLQLKVYKDLFLIVTKSNQAANIIEF